jgi:hypothetical protein
MAATLLKCTKGEQRSVIQFLWSGAVEAGKMYGRLIVQTGHNCETENILRDGRKISQEEMMMMMMMIFPGGDRL